jgi:hypothetical protein
MRVVFSYIEAKRKVSALSTHGNSKIFLLFDEKIKESTNENKSHK